MRIPTFIVALMVSSVAFAGKSEPGKITDLYFMKDGVIALTINANHIHNTSDQQCVTEQPKTWAIDGKTDEGKAQASGIMLAYTMGKMVEATGNGKCDIHPSRESIDYFRIID